MDGASYAAHQAHTATTTHAGNTLTGLRAVLAGDKALKALFISPQAQRGQAVHCLRLHVKQVEKLATPREHHLHTQ